MLHALLLAALLHFNHPCAAVKLYVRPTQLHNPACPDPCHTLDQYARNVSLFEGHTNISLLFLHGKHKLTHDFSIAGHNTFVANGPHNRAVIELQSNTAIYVSDMVVFGLYNITITGNLIHSINTNKVTGQPLRIINIRNMYQYQVVLENIDVEVLSRKMPLQSTVITKCYYNCSKLRFKTESTQKSTITFQESNIISRHLLRPGIQTGLSYECSSQESTKFSLDVSNSTVLDWYYGISINCSKSPESRLTITNTHIFHSISGIKIDSDIDSFTIQGSQFTNNVFGVALTSVDVNNFTIQDTRYTHNNNALLAVNTTLHNMLVKDSVFSQSLNTGVTVQSRSIERSNISFKNCTFACNNGVGNALVNLQGSRSIVRYSDCSFHDNKGTPILAYQSDFELSGQTSFFNNEADKGGALCLIYSTVRFGSGSKITFRNNSALEFGGAIYVKSSISILTALAILDIVERHLLTPAPATCFYYYEPDTTPQVVFINNNATFGGIDIYGASSYDNDCSISGNGIFSFTESVSTTSSVTSEPSRACFCDSNSTLCKIKLKSVVQNVTHFPGETFTVPLVLVGYNFSTVTGTVYATVLDNDSFVHMKQDQHAQIADFRQCNNLEYTIFSNKSSQIIALSAEEYPLQGTEETDIRFISSENNPEFLHIYVNITLKDCPLGFVLNEKLTCGCDHNLNKLRNYVRFNVTCQVEDDVGYIYREGTVWMGIDKNENNTNAYLTNMYCPHNYCNTNSTPVDLTNPDIQCSSNRSGVLCGSCAPGHSLQLGGNQCLQCPSNNTLALLIFFAAAGFLLVFFIKLLNLTVAYGTINGLIFYANVIWRYNDILFSLNDRKNIAYSMLTVPIAWINLDFGIETCFFDGLDQIGKSLLQFVFPVYIWIIAGLIILVSHYSTRATKLFGNNSVAVLATLFLLSYGKLFRNIIDTFAHAELAVSNNSTCTVWSFDGNVPYGGSKHIVLVSIGLLFLIFFVVPFTLILLTVPCLKRKSHLKPLRWINTLKPFFDTYYGPFKHKMQYQCWTGVLLIARIILLIIFAATSTSSPNANILSLGVIAAMLLMYSAIMGSPIYRKWSVSVMENFYLINLIILSGAFLFYKTQEVLDNEKHINYMPLISISFALLQFACTIVFHLMKKCFSCKTGGHGSEEEYRNLQSNAENKKMYSNNYFREPLLESTDSY